VYGTGRAAEDDGEIVIGEDTNVQDLSMMHAAPYATWPIS
jgi:carbonic anhydrase/acetyltransferase-like protein (isoleucine patch superfamily)